MTADNDVRLYLDTSIWLDHFEARNEQGFPKGDIAADLLAAAAKNEWTLIVSHVVFEELEGRGYLFFEREQLFAPFQKLIELVEPTDKQIRRARDLSRKRNVPVRDALHALIARDMKAVIITYDRHFWRLADITVPSRPSDFV